MLRVRNPLLAEGGQHLHDEVVSQDKAKLSRDPFGDTRVFFEGPTSQLKSMTAGSLLLKPGMEPHPPHQHPEEEIIIVASGHARDPREGEKVPVRSQLNDVLRVEQIARYQERGYRAAPVLLLQMDGIAF